MLAGAGAITIGSLLPWASATSIFGTVSKAGTDGDGIITLGLGVLFGIWAFMNLAPRARIAAGCVVALIALYEIVDVLGTGHDDLVVSVGIGLWIVAAGAVRSEEHTSELQSLMRISYAVFCLKKKIN